MPGVKDNVLMNWWFGGIYRDPKNFFANIAIEPQAFLEVYPEFMLPPDQKEKWLHDRRGCIVGRKLAQRFGWKVGDTFSWRASFPPTEWDIPSTSSSTASTTPMKPSIPAPT